MTTMHLDRRDWQRGGQALAWVAVGTALAVAGARARGISAVILAAVGSFAIRRGVDEAATWIDSIRARPASSTPAREEPRDAVDEASWESFPASDPPPYVR